MSEYGPENKSTFLHAVETPKALFIYRLVTGIGAIVSTAAVGAIVTMFSGMSKDIVDIKVSAALAVGRTDLLGSRVDALSHRLIRTDERMDKLGDRVTNIQIGRP